MLMGGAPQSIVEEHSSTELWVTSNYKLETTPQQELEFGLQQLPEKTYPGEDDDCKTDTERKPAHGLRRRQKLEDLWRKKHAQLEVFMSAPALSLHAIPPSSPLQLSILPRNPLHPDFGGGCSTTQGSSASYAVLCRRVGVK